MAAAQGVEVAEAEEGVEVVEAEEHVEVLEEVAAGEAAGAARCDRQGGGAARPARLPPAGLR